MKILLTGGGTGGHITPILAVGHELKKLDSSCHTIYVGERGSKFTSLTANHASINEVHAISAGKFRRYHGESWLRRLVDLETNIKNIIDIFKVVVGISQAWFLLGKVKPDVVFLKGGFVGVPVGLAASLRGLPIVTHDSDAIPGLANRLISRWTRAHATALDARFYKYTPNKVYPVGVLVEHDYQFVTEQKQAEYKKTLGLSPAGIVLLVTGGSSGAERVNLAFKEIVAKLLNDNPQLQVIHQVGKGKTGVYGDFTHERLIVVEFMSPMHVYTGASDLIVTRAGANAMAEFGIQAKACIVVPNPDLTGGHQTKNADLLEEQGAAVVIKEELLRDPELGLLACINKLLNNKTRRLELAQKLKSRTIPDAAHKLAVLLLETAKK